jgi:uncharacterized membrane protein
LRWNSWDVLLEPTRLVGLTAALLQPWAHVKGLAVTIIFGAILTLGYLTFQVLIQPEYS